MSSEIRDDLKYTKSHEWVHIIDSIARIGITDHAQSEMTDIVFAELPEVEKQVKKGDELCVVESVKSVSEIYTPVSGKIIKINEKLEDAPEIINESPYDDGWLVEIEIQKKDEIETLISASEYKKLV
jgi:glycine cleavage system H protein